MCEKIHRSYTKGHTVSHVILCDIVQVSALLLLVSEGAEGAILSKGKEGYGLDPPFLE